jgi:energy-coupling factor transport system permease protein
VNSVRDYKFMKISEAIILGRYIKRESFFHKFHPAYKIFLLFIFTIIIFFLNETGLLALFILILFLTAIAKLNIFLLIKGLKPVIILLLITFLMNLLFIRTGRKIYIDFLNISITTDAIKDGLFFSTQIIISMFFAALLTLTTTPIEMVKGIELLLMPLKYFKFPVMQISLMFVIALKFIPITLKELENIYHSQKSRGINFKILKLNQKVYYFLSLLLPLFVVTLKKTEHLAIALEMKCFNLMPKKITLKNFGINISEFVFFGINIYLFIIIIIFFRK